MASNTTATFEDVKKIKDDPITLLIDVREPSELKEFGEIPGSINIPLSEVEGALNLFTKEEFQSKYGIEKPEKEVPIVFSCRSGRRSGLAQETAFKLGYKNVRNYTGGWLDWEEKMLRKN